MGVVVIVWYLKVVLSVSDCSVGWLDIRGEFGFNVDRGLFMRIYTEGMVRSRRKGTST